MRKFITSPRFRVLLVLTFGDSNLNSQGNPVKNVRTRHLPSRELEPILDLSPSEEDG